MADLAAVQRLPSDSDSRIQSERSGRKTGSSTRQRIRGWSWRAPARGAFGWEGIVGCKPAMRTVCCATAKNRCERVRRH
jgi:hypothetical protein